MNSPQRTACFPKANNITMHYLETVAAMRSGKDNPLLKHVVSDKIQTQTQAIGKS